MTKQENVDYLTLRAEECRYSEDIVKKVNARLKTLDEKDFDHLKKISEPEFRKFCTDAAAE